MELQLYYHARYLPSTSAKRGIGVEADVARALHFRNLAEEIRIRASLATSDQTRQMFLKLAEDYDAMAKMIEDGGKNRPESK